jgi:hypothetical protein
VRLADAWAVGYCNSGHVHIRFCARGEGIAELAVSPDEAYGMAQEIFRAFDTLEGIK